MTVQIPYVYVILMIVLAIVVGFIMILSFSKKIGLWGIFSKAGEDEWKSLVPIYNQIVLLKKCRLSPWLVLLQVDFIIPLIGFLVGRDITWITTIMLIGLLCYRFMISVRLSFCFKKGAAFAFFMGLFPSVFYPIVGCSKKIEYTKLQLKKDLKNKE